VELGYRVIDEYIKQGATFAAPFTASKRASTQTPPPSVTPERMLQYASDFTSIWFDAMSTLISGRGVAHDGAAAGAAPCPSEPRPARVDPSQPSTRAEAPIRVQLALTTRQLVNVSLTLEESFSAASRTRVEPLQSPRGTSSIDGVSIGPSDGTSSIDIKLTISDGTPVGRYTGAIIDSVTKSPQGRITVTVAE
jgi:hypothetical protein